MVELYQHRAGAMKSTGAAEPKWGGDNNRFCLKHFCVIVDLGSFFDTGTDGHPGATLYCWTSLKLQKDCMDQIFTDPAVSSKWWIFRLWVNWPFRTNVNLSLSSEGGKMAWRHHFLSCCGSAGASRLNLKRARGSRRGSEADAQRLLSHSQQLTHLRTSDWTNFQSAGDKLFHISRNKTNQGELLPLTLTNLPK